MKNLKIILMFLAFLTILVQGCEDAETVSVPNFTVTPVTEIIKVGEPIEFQVNNAPNFLRFYSGEFGHQYKYKDRTNAEGTVTMSFENSQKWGLGENATGTLSVWYSKDYDGSGTAEAVNNATWVDISE